MGKRKKTRFSPEAETPFERFQKLAKKVVSIPKEKIRHHEKDKYRSSSSKVPNAFWGVAVEYFLSLIPLSSWINVRYPNGTV